MVLYNDIIRFEVIDKEASFIFEEVMQKVISTFLVLSFLVPPLKKEKHTSIISPWKVYSV